MATRDGFALGVARVPGNGAGVEAPAAIPSPKAIAQGAPAAHPRLQRRNTRRLSGMCQDGTGALFRLLAIRFAGVPLRKMAENTPGFLAPFHDSPSGYGLFATYACVRII